MIVRIVSILFFLNMTIVRKALSSDTLLQLRAQPVPLQNPDGRCIRNALLQASIPLVLESMQLHAQRTKHTRTDAEWVALVQSQPRTRIELTAISLARAALAVNAYTSDLAIETNPFSNAVLLTNFGLAETQYSLIAHEIADGLTRLTAVRISYCQLPSDRDTISSFDMGKHISQQLSDRPDYLIIDASSSNTYAFDKYTPLSGTSLSLCAEKPLPARFALPEAATQPEATYELVSFCNFERSGISHTPSVWSQLGSFFQWASAGLGMPLHTFPIRHATAVVRYGDIWFLAEDTRIWRIEADAASSFELGQALLQQYPGMRTILFYKKIQTDKDHAQATIEPLQQRNIIFKKVSPYRNTPLSERPEMYLFAIVALFCISLYMSALYAAAWRGFAEWRVRPLRALLIIAWIFYVFRILIGGSIHSIYNLQVVYRASQDLIEIPAHSTHMSGLYSTVPQEIVEE